MTRLIAPTNVRLVGRFRAALVADLQSIATTSASLTTQIRAAAALHAIATGTMSLTTQIRLVTAMQAVGTCTAALTGGSGASYPDSTNTGYRNAPGYTGSLTTSGVTSAVSNTTYSHLLFPGGIDVLAGVTGVVFNGCRFTSNAVVDANCVVNGEATFNYCSFEPTTANAAAPPVLYNKGYQYGIDQRALGASIIIDHCDFWGWGNGIQFKSSSQANPFIVRDSWFHDARDDGGQDHTDGILCDGPGTGSGDCNYAVFNHNTIVSVGNTNGLALQYDVGNTALYDNLTVTNNYFSGFGYTLALGNHGKISNMTFTDNVLATDIQYGFGPLYDWITGGTNNSWRRNKWKVIQPTSAQNPPNWYTTTSDDGKYWWPDGTKSSTDYSGT